MDSTGASSGHFNQEVSNKPLWNYVTKYESVMDVAMFHGNAAFATRLLRVHTLGLKCQWIKKCPNVTIDDISKRQKLDEEAKLRLNKSPNLAQRLALPPPNVSFGCISTFVQGGDKSKKRKTSPSSSRSRNENPTEATNYATARDQVNAWNFLFCLYTLVVT
ncbi:hypothetical protein LguiA_003297 [Lonicera macranthoides]